MFIRMATIKISPGSRDQVQGMAGQIKAMLDGIDGLTDTTFFMDDAAGIYGSMTRWESQEKLDAGETIIRAKLPEILSGVDSPPEIKVYEVYSP